MATFDSRRLIDQIIKNGGYIDEANSIEARDQLDNPPAIKIVEYENYRGNTCWGVVFAGELDPYRYERPTQYIRNPRVIWEISEDEGDIDA